MCRYSVVVPCYCSGTWLPELVERLVAVFNELGDSFEIILVNDASPDATWQSIEDLAERYESVVGVDLLFNTGQYRATLCGLQRARGEFVLTMDDDLQHPPEEIPKLIEGMRDAPDLDCVLGRLTVKKHGLIRNFASRCVGVLFQLCYGKPADLELSSFRLMTRQLAHTLSLYPTVNPVINSLILRSTHRIRNADVEHHARTRGKSGYSYFKLAQIVVQNVLSVSTLPLKLISILGLLSAAASFLLGCYYLVRHLIKPSAQPGFATIVLLTVFFGGMMLFSIGLLGEYIKSITEEVKGRPLYVVRRAAGQTSDGVASLDSPHESANDVAADEKRV